ncbi:glycoside-pentoside-hexuronide (GPH):cation symporter, partial [Limosilactobacillus mucosae]|nr:glycoside-pentoside-hexuronide (GPH):cation symporter [Limosilactobacillus mucosae]
IMVLRIVELVIDPFIGNVIDKTDTKWGHFKPWVVAGGIVSAVAISLLFTNLWGLTYKNPVLYLVVFAILYITMDIFYSFNDVAFWSMIPAISFDSAEREKTATFARVGSTLGGQLVGVVVMPIVLAFSLSSNGGSGDSRGWFAFAAIVAAISAITACGVGVFTHEKKNELRENKENTTFKKVFGVLLHNDQLMAIAVTYLVYTTGVQIVNSFQLYYFTYILGRASTYTLYALINGVIGAVTVALFPALAKKFSRMKVFYYSILVLLIGLAIFAFAGQSLPMVILGGAIYMLPQPLIFMVVLMIIT